MEKWALITRSSRGIGRATAIKLAKEGANRLKLDFMNESTNRILPGEKFVYYLEGYVKQEKSIKVDVSYGDISKSFYIRVIENPEMDTGKKENMISPEIMLLTILAIIGGGAVISKYYSSSF